MAGTFAPCPWRARWLGARQQPVSVGPALGAPAQPHGGTYRRWAILMAELGWTALRVRDLTRGGYKKQVRGYVRGGRGLTSPH